MAGCYVHWRLPVVGGQIRPGTGFKQHERASVTVRHSGSYVKRRFSKLSTSNVNLSPVSQQRLHNRWFRVLHGYVKRGVMVVRGRVHLYTLHVRGRSVIRVETNVIFSREIPSPLVEEVCL